MRYSSAIVRLLPHSIFVLGLNGAAGYESWNYFCYYHVECACVLEQEEAKLGELIKTQREHSEMIRFMDVCLHLHITTVPGLHFYSHMKKVFTGLYAEKLSKR